MRKSKYIVLLLLLAGLLVKGQTTVVYNVTDAGDYDPSTQSPIPGCLREAIINANNDLLNGNNAVINLNAPGLCQIITQLPTLTKLSGTTYVSNAATLTIQKSSAATSEQGIEFAGNLSDNSFKYALDMDIREGLTTIDGLTFRGFSRSGISGNSRYCIFYKAAFNTIVKNCIFDYNNSKADIAFNHSYGNALIEYNEFKVAHAAGGSRASIIADTYGAGAVPRSDFKIRNNTFRSLASTKLDRQKLPSSSIELYISDNFDYLVANNNFDNACSYAGMYIEYFRVMSSPGTHTFSIDNNTFLNHYYAALAMFPNRHWILQNNKFTDNSVDIDFYAGGSPNPGGGYIHADGFRIIEDNNEYGVTPFNTKNVFNTHTSPSCGMYQIGCFGPFPLGIDLVGLDMAEGYIAVAGSFFSTGPTSNNVKVLDTKIKTTVQNKPVFLNKQANYITNYCPAIEQSQTFVFFAGTGNKGINSPLITRAELNGNKLKVSYELDGDQIVQSNATFRVEFYKSNGNGDLVEYLGHEDVAILNGLNRSNQTDPNDADRHFAEPEFTLAANTLTSGDVIAATVTSIGTLPGLGTLDPTSGGTVPYGVGTSEAAYGYAFEKLSCENCIPSFKPEEGKTYILGAWVSQAGNKNGLAVLDRPSVVVTFSVGSTTSSVELKPSGSIIDGWQRIEQEFSVPAGTTDIFVELKCSNTSSTGQCNFDDIRIFPKDGTMKSYVYDPNTLRLVAELDERNYATLYEYDEEGKLVRVKKETERGVMTIKESRNNTSKLPQRP